VPGRYHVNQFGAQIEIFMALAARRRRWPHTQLLIGADGTRACRSVSARCPMGELRAQG